jgi:hypothetical protein
MSPIRKVIGVCLVLALVLLSGNPGEASASRKKVASGASLESVSADGVSGRVSSPQGPCRARRTVRVYMLNSASPPTTVPFATAITSGDGTWSIGEWAFPGEYYAVAATKTTRDFVCRTATSNSVTWWTSGAAS